MKRILLVDDETELREMLRRVLEHEGYEVCEAGDGLEAMEVFRRERPDLVITDIQMPKRGGALFIMQLRQEFPGTRIIAISGGGAENLDPQVCLDMAVSLDVNHALLKPFHANDLLKAVRKQIGS